MKRKLGVTVMVALALMVAACTTSAARPSGVVTGVSDTCSNSAPPGSPVKVVLSAGPTVVASESLHLGGTYRFVVAPGGYGVTDYVSGKMFASASVVVHSGRTFTFDFQCVVPI